jgi:DNA-binding transcriptional ArsR family regulator
MGVLENAGLVAAQRRGKWIYYRLTAKGSVDLP